MLYLPGRAAFVLLFMLQATTSVTAQRHYELVLETGVSQDPFKVRDAGGNLEKTPAVGFLAGLSLRTRKGDNDRFYEVGALVKQYVAGFGLKQQTFTSSNTMDLALLLPLRLGYKINSSDRPAITTTIGVVPAFKLSPADGRQGAYSDSNPYRALEWHYTVRPVGKDLYLLFQGGVAFEHQPRMFPNLKLTLSGTYYYQWLTTVTAVDFDYRINSEPVRRAYVFGRGRFFNWGLGLHYAFR